MSVSTYFGVALFEHPDKPRAGWCAVANQEATPFADVQALSPKIQWITNLDRFQHQLLDSAWPHIHPDDLFRVRLMTIAEDLGYDGGPVEQPGLVADLAEVVQRIAELASRHYALPAGHPNPMAWIQGHLQNGIPWHPPLPTVLQAFNLARQTYHAIDISHDYRTKPFTLRFNRVAHAQRLCQHVLPQGDWQRAENRWPKNERQPGTNGAVYQYLISLGEQQPALARLTFRDPVNPAYAKLLDPISRNHVREWFTVQEAAQLAAYGTVVIKEILVGERYYDTKEMARWAVPDEGPMAPASLSFGLLCEMHWSALASPLSMPVGNGPTRVTQNSPVGLWLYSWDRLYTLQAAKAYVDAGITVSMYGQGAVHIQLRPDQTAQAIHLAHQVDLIPSPALLASETLTQGAVDYA